MKNWLKISMINWAALLFLLWLFSAPRVRAQIGQTIHYVTLEGANIFQQRQTFLNGVQLNGASSGSVKIVSPTGANYQMSLPSGVGSAGACICNTSVPGVLGYCAQ